MQPGRPTGPQLPSIRDLHPYLPPPSGIIPAKTPPLVPPSTSAAPPPNFVGQQRRPSSDAGSRDNEHEDDNHKRRKDDDPDSDSEPPRKKRRRQALSCTECKRRKIRCDRAQPCGPCARRGDEAKCQWHVVETASEKYVPRAEHDALRRRVETLENYLRRIPPPILGSLPPFPGLMPPNSAPFSGSPLPHIGLPPPPVPGPVPPYETPYHYPLYPVSVAGRFDASAFGPPPPPFVHGHPVYSPTPEMTTITTGGLSPATLVPRAKTSSPSHSRRLPPTETAFGSSSNQAQRPPVHRRRASAYEHTYSGYPPPPLRPLLPRQPETTETPGVSNASQGASNAPTESSDHFRAEEDSGSGGAARDLAPVAGDTHDNQAVTSDNGRNQEDQNNSGRVGSISHLLLASLSTSPLSTTPIQPVCVLRVDAVVAEEADSVFDGLMPAEALVETSSPGLAVAPIHVPTGRATPILSAKRNALKAFEGATVTVDGACRVVATCKPPSQTSCSSSRRGCGVTLARSRVGRSTTTRKNYRCQLCLGTRRCPRAHHP
ncbi:C6 transcriptional factoral factor [Mycena indigotica]|uniref:C6 transcriptional factoral factor n=1 Tax=Mycena indigotica TaxID=2126181 RepID=A0A8H6T2S0_9AGAR|nr:C6 transcriptional factoral factor [Mycena indigotica]KAF7309307.1 C6 transcriptional factoral factor [Mycena indigotica]